MAEWEAQKLMQAPKSSGAQSDQFGQQLFKLIAGAHASVFGCKPVTRAKTGDPIGGSVEWAQAVIRHAISAIETSPHSTALPLGADLNASTGQAASALAQSRQFAAPYVARLRDLAALSARRLADLLDQGWNAWHEQAAYSAR